MMRFILQLCCLLLVYQVHSQDLKPFVENHVWGYKDGQGKVKIPPQYQYSTKFIMNAAIVAVNDTLAAIDSNNKIIIPFRYQYLRLLDANEFLFGYRAYYYGEYFMGVMTRSQQIKIPAEYSHISRSHNFYVVTKKEDSVIQKTATGDIFSSRSFYGLMDNDGNVVIPCKYDYLDWLNDSLIVLTARGKETKQALFNTKGKQLTEFVYMVIGKFHNGLAKARIADRFGFISPDGKVAIPIAFEYCEEFKNGYAFIMEKDKWGAIDITGKVIVPVKYTHDYVEKLVY